jgi:hypothetical protein
LTQGDTERPPRRRSRASRFSRGATQLTGLLVTVGALFVVVLALSLVLYAARREVARQALVGWLEERGVEAQVDFERLDPDGLVASIRAGDPDNPDLIVERVEMDYRLGMPWSGGFSIQPSRIRLIRPEVRATLADGRISFGALDPVIEDFTSRPPAPDSESPLILVEDGRLRLATRGGPLVALVDARLQDGRLITLDAGISAARMRDDALSLDLDRAGLAVRTVGSRTSIALVAEVEQASAAGLEAREGLVRLCLSAPYPDAAARRVQGPVDASVEADLALARWQGGEATGLDADLSFDGQATGWIEVFALLGRLDGQVSADTLQAGDARLTRAALVLDGEQVRFSRRDEIRWRYEGGARIFAASAVRDGLSGQGVTLSVRDFIAGGTGEATETRGALVISADALSQDELTLTGVTGAFDLASSHSGASLTTLTGGVQASGGRWPILGAVGPDDVPEQAALKRAFQAFSLSAPGLQIRTGSPGTEVALTRPATVTPATGGQIVISARPGQGLFSAPPDGPGGGGLLIRASGGGLPDLRAEVTRYQMSDGIIASLRGEADFDFGLARGASVSTEGLLRIADGGTSFIASGCSPFTATLLELGENDVSDVSASLCPVPGRPLVTIADGWRFEAEARALSAAAPFLGMRVSDASGRVSANDPGGSLAIDARVADGVITDLEDPVRFHPLRGSGRVGLADEVWSGLLQLRDVTQGRRVADVTITHSGLTESGGAEFDATGLVFTPEGLQPADLSPLAVAFLGREVSGQADFTGGFRWTPDGATSSGRLTTPGLDFTSPVGRVTQARGTIEFLSLTPLVTAPGQRLTAQEIEAFLPLADADIGFELRPTSVLVSGGRIAVAGGFASLEPVEIPFDPNTSWEGVLVLENVQMGELFARSGFADSVQLDAVVSGRVPFVYGPNGVTIIEGQVAAVQPGRLSINREVLTGMAAEGGGEAVPPNTVQDFAYQALENLWFDQMEATLNSLPEGRLGVLFTVHGRHDPPVEQEIRLTIMEVIQQDFLNRVLPLPSGTEINLTLDTSFNLDQLVEDLMEIQRARDAGREQP